MFVWPRHQIDVSMHASRSLKQGQEVDIAVRFKGWAEVGGDGQTPRPATWVPTRQIRRHITWGTIAKLTADPSRCSQTDPYLLH